ncbi:TetR/AcrR family transcriptional regulator [Azospirillum picis]|uniref:TetR/AcrR family transcriptional repressor of nem operon n=1 Tax=Azospirillum picis TaxID=488438 RepID=A0ABU0MS23_9PROT|nr:TetR/AcrR family transcriptional regulator [Azospirillum picis]MBP2302628.1 TetR/AcrR family transcriptional repressor of nem operon [Azospirillum picis]MDQ0536289.1 TetR/AcrR family transcriptional repressor of nem operon [Azospirillum picis]
MRVSKEQAAENRRRIVDVAGMLFRERGFNGIGVVDLMKEAGLTHGGFYGHFASKDDLAAEACARAMEEAAERWRRTADERGGDALPALLTSYLSQRHRDHSGAGCPMAALGVDAARQGGAARGAFTRGLRPFIDLLGRLVPGRSAEARRKAALATLSGMVGALVLARAVDDPALSDEILEAARTAFAEAGDSGA